MNTFNAIIIDYICPTISGLLVGYLCLNILFAILFACMDWQRAADLATQRSASSNSVVRKLTLRRVVDGSSEDDPADDDQGERERIGCGSGGERKRGLSEKHRRLHVITKDNSEEDDEGKYAARHVGHAFPWRSGILTFLPSFLPSFLPF